VDAGRRRRSGICSDRAHRTHRPGNGQDPWKKIAEQAAAGKIVFEPIAAQTAAAECADAIGRILGLQKAITDTDSLEPLSQLTFGGVLSTRFNNTLRGLNDVLGSHKTVLTEMLGTFKAAGNDRSSPTPTFAAPTHTVTPRRSW
jgi:hypothetical protein